MVSTFDFLIEYPIFYELNLYFYSKVTYLRQKNKQSNYNLLQQNAYPNTTKTMIIATITPTNEHSEITNYYRSQINSNMQLLTTIEQHHRSIDYYAEWKL